MINNIEDPRICVICVSAHYDAGKLHGVWINANQDATQIQDEIRAMLAQSPVPDAEEWDISDYDGFWGLDLFEWKNKDTDWKSLNTLTELASLIAEYSKLGVKVLEYCNSELDFEHCDSALKWVRESLESNYMGCYRSVEDYASTSIHEL